jgi:hypothetical protein
MCHVVQVPCIRLADEPAGVSFSPLRATLCRLAHQQGVLEEREQQELAMGQLSRRLADREGQVAHLRQQLQEVRGSCGEGKAGRLGGPQR